MMVAHPDESLEVEVKFYLPELQAFRERLLAAGAEQVKPRLFERNVRFDSPGERLRFQFQLLRLRRDDRIRLTFKGPPPEEGETEAKVREELEVEVSDFETTAAILERLGFPAQQVYEKYRETFHLGAVEIVLDEMPFGNFVELEGEEEAIRAAAARLGLDWEQRILDNYLALMARLKEEHHLDFDDATFDNFAGRDLSIAAIL